MQQQQHNAQMMGPQQPQGTIPASSHRTLENKHKDPTHPTDDQNTTMTDDLSDYSSSVHDAAATHQSSHKGSQKHLMMMPPPQQQ